MMIPRVINYCWFGGNPLPDDAKKYIDSWRRYCPGYEIKEWNEANFDFSDCRYAAEAYKAKKWAFVSDYARFRILYENGGLYFDTDVELIRPIDDILEKGPFIGLEKVSPSGSNQTVGANPGLGLAAVPGLGFYKTMIDKYMSAAFVNSDGSDNLTTVVRYTTDELIKLGLKDADEIQKIGPIYIYPSDYFCPKNYISEEMNITENTRSIHHYAMSWHSESEKYAFFLRKKLYGIIPAKPAGYIANFIAAVRYEGLRSAVKRVVKTIRKTDQ